MSPTIELLADVAILSERTDDLFEQLDSACGMLETVGKVKDNPYMGSVCENCCGEIIHPEDFGDPDNHTDECDIPDIFATRDRIRREREAAKLAAELATKKEDPDA